MSIIRLLLPAIAFVTFVGTLLAQGDMTVIVAPFENNSTARAPFTYEVRANAEQAKRSFTIDRYTEAPRAVLEDIFVSYPGITVLERNRVDALILESEFASFSEPMDAGTAVRLGKMLGADAVVIGTINDVRSEERTFEGYGVKSTRAQVAVSLRIRVIDVESGTIRLSQIFRGSVEFGEGFRGTADSEVAYSIIEGTLESLRTDQDFLESVKRLTSPEMGDQVTVEFSPLPENCDVEIDGVFVGTAPLNYSGASDQLIEVRISKPGYQPWVKTMRLNDGMRIAPELAKEIVSTGSGSESP